MQPEQLGPYQIVERLGRGGMGTVYSGINLETQEHAAVKVLARELGHNDDFRQRFASEIATLRRLNHPNIVRLFGFGEQDDQLFYAMELVDGVSLEEEIKRGRRFTWREAARIGSETCLALRHAHDRGVIHRDIKPANLLLAPDGTAKLSDFGIARLFGSTRMTTAGSVIGTVEYMAPEQADGRPVGQRADLYSLAGVMFALLAGRSPFVAKTLPEMLHKQRYDTPKPIAELVADVPSIFSELIAKLLAKDPADRFPNASVLGRHLDALLSSDSAHLAPLASDENGLNGGSDNDRSENDDVGFETAPPSRIHAVHDPEALAVTRDAGDSNPPAPTPNSATPNSATPNGATPNGATNNESLPETRATAAFQAIEPPPKEDLAETSLPEPKKANSSTGRFTVVPHEELDQAPANRKETNPLISAQTWVLVAALIIIGMGAWYALQPPSADALYERIAEKTADGKTESILSAKDDIEKFLINHADDPRCKSLAGFEREIRLDNFSRKFKRRVRNKQLLPIDQAYIEAGNYAWLDPELGLRKFEALVDLYGHDAGITGPTSQCLELARCRIEKLREELGESTSGHLDMLNARLDHADTLFESEPEEATAIWKAAIELYAQKPWAAQAVSRAEAAIEKANEL